MLNRVLPHLDLASKLYLNLTSELKKGHYALGLHSSLCFLWKTGKLFHRAPLDLLPESTLGKVGVDTCEQRACISEGRGPVLGTTKYLHTVTKGTMTKTSDLHGSTLILFSHNTT